MKIEIEIPDWADERVIQILAGTERVAYRFPQDIAFKIKTSRCNMCGKCCQQLKSNHIFPVVNGQCIYLEKESGSENKWRCSLGPARPYSCCTCTPKKISECTEKYE